MFFSKIENIIRRQISLYKTQHTKREWAPRTLTNTGYDPVCYVRDRKNSSAWCICLAAHEIACFKCCTPRVFCLMFFFNIFHNRIPHLPFCTRSSNVTFWIFSLKIWNLLCLCPNWEFGISSGDCIMYSSPFARNTPNWNTKKLFFKHVEYHTRVQNN